MTISKTVATLRKYMYMYIRPIHINLTKKTIFKLLFYSLCVGQWSDK